MRTVVVAVGCLAVSILVGVSGDARVLAGGRAGDLPGSAIANGKPVAEAVVWLDAPGAPRAAHPPKAVLDQRNMSFYPHVLAVQTGTNVEFPNHDRVFHSVFSFKDGKPFDLGLYPVGAVKHVHFDQAGLSRIFCNIHPHMTAYVMVVDTPYFAVSDEAGRFVMLDVPAGSYRYHAWRPGGDQIAGDVVAAAGASLVVAWR